MKKLLVIATSAICIFLFTRCGLIIGFANMMDDADTGRLYRKLERNNKKFDRDGWYEFEHTFNPDSLNAYYLRKDSLILSDFYLPEEYNYVEKNMRLRSELDTFTCNGVDFSPSRNALLLRSGQPKKELDDARHFYIDLGANEVASCFITKESIFIPYILIKKEEIIAKPKPYLPLLPLAEYKKSLTDFRQVKHYDHVIRIEKPPMLVDTSQRFQQFLATFSEKTLFTPNITEIDTNLYEVSHRIQYNFYRDGKNENYYRFQFMEFYDIGDLIQVESYYSEPSDERYFKPKTKLIYKEKLDQLFKQLAKEHPEFLKKRR
jgi:hypothetical protein